MEISTLFGLIEENYTWRTNTDVKSRSKENSERKESYMKKKTFITVAVIMVIMLFMTSCGYKKTAEDSSLKT